MAFDPTALIALSRPSPSTSGRSHLPTARYLPGRRTRSKKSRRSPSPTSWASSLLRRLNIKLALISGEPSPLVDRYAKKMNIPFVAKGTRDKAGALRDFATKFDIPLSNTCFFGDDVNDLSAMEIAGLCACPANAAAEVHAYVAQHGFVSSQPGGRGAVREFKPDAILAASRPPRSRRLLQVRPPA